MTDQKLSQLSAANAISDTDLFYVVQSPGTSQAKATGAQIKTYAGGGSGTIAATTDILSGDGAGNAVDAGTAGGVITSNLSQALAVGPNGATNPVFQVDGSVVSQATGVSVQGTAAGSVTGTILQSTSSATNENITLRSKGTGNTYLDTQAAASNVVFRVNQTTKIAVGSAQINFTATSPNTSAVTARFSVASGADTALTASTEAPHTYFNLGTTRQHATGAITLQRDFRVTGSTHSAVAASIITDVATFSIDGPASAGTNVTTTNAHGIYIPSATITGNVGTANAASFSAPTGGIANYALNLNAGGMTVDGSNNFITSGTLNSGSQVIAGTEIITSNSASAFTVGPAGVTNPVFQVDDSVASQATGIVVQGQATGTQAAITVTDSGANAGLLVSTKGSGPMNFNIPTTSGNYHFELGGTSRFSISNLSYTFGPSASGTASSVRFGYTAGADAGLTASTEGPLQFFNNSATRQWATGTLALQRDFRIAGSTYAFVAASTLTAASAASITPGGAGTNATVTTYSALNIETANVAAAGGTVTNAYGLIVNAPSGAATNNGSAQFIGGDVTVTAGGNYRIATGSFTGAATANGTLQFPSSVTGPIFQRNVASDTLAVLTIKNVSASSTGDLLDVIDQTTNKFSVKISGQVVNGGATPGIAGGTGAGSSPTITIAGVNSGGLISVTTGATPATSGVIATVTYSAAFPNGSYVVLYPANAATALLSGTSMVFTTGSTSTFTITAGTVALTTLTAYAWNYQVVGN